MSGDLRPERRVPRAAALLPPPSKGVSSRVDQVRNSAEYQRWTGRADSGRVVQADGSAVSEQVLEQVRNSALYRAWSRTFGLRDDRSGQR